MHEKMVSRIHKQTAELRLFEARRAVDHLVELHRTGRWHLYYKEDTFLEALREAKQEVELWEDELRQHRRPL